MKPVVIKAAVSVLALVFAVILLQGVHLVRPNSIERAISQDLAPQSDLASVHRFMDTHHILYAGYSPELHCAYGKVYHSSIGLMQGHILVEFNFNEDGKLVSHKVVELFEPAM